jgi:hypothetical protein
MSNSQDMNTQPYIPKFRQTPIREMPTQVWERPLPEPEPPTPEHRPRRSLRWLETMMIILFLVISVTLATMGSLILYRVDWVAPRVTVAGIDLGERTQAEAAAALQTAWQSKAILVEAGENDRVVTPADLGLTLDADTTAVLARQQGRTWTSWRGFV